MMTLMMTAIALAIAAPAAAQTAADPHAGHSAPEPKDKASDCCDKNAAGKSNDCCDKAKSRDCCEKSGDADASTGHAHGHAIGINGTVPAPLLRLREGTARPLSVTNDLDEDTSLHWHGLLVPVPDGWRAGHQLSRHQGRDPASLMNFPVRQAGTYWYHSHSGLQEQMGHYGPIVIDPAANRSDEVDREHVILLSDHSRMHPQR
jgi:hypothetical protein